MSRRLPGERAIGVGGVRVVRGVQEMREVLRLPDDGTASDLATFVGRARRADPDGAARLVARGDVLAVYVSPVHGGGGPVVLGLRTVRLVVAVDLDVTLPLADLADRLARTPSAPGPEDLERPPAREDVRVEVPGEGPGASVGVPWAGTSPPRAGWEPVAAVDPAVLVACSASGIAEVATGATAGSGAAAVATLRGRIWGRPLTPELPGLPAGVAFAADVLGFLDAGQPATVFRSGPWWRLSTSRGHVLARRPALLQPTVQPGG